MDRPATTLQIAALAVRVLAVMLVLEVVALLSAAPVYDTVFGEDGFIEFAALSGIGLLLLAAALWRFALPLARWLCSGIATEDADVGDASLEVAALSVLGIYLALSALPGLATAIALPLFTDSAELVGASPLDIVHGLATVAVGVALALRSTGLVRIVRRLRGRGE